MMSESSSTHAFDEPPPANIFQFNQTIFVSPGPGNEKLLEGASATQAPINSIQGGFDAFTPSARVGGYPNVGESGREGQGTRSHLLCASSMMVSASKLARYSTMYSNEVYETLGDLIFPKAFSTVQNPNSVRTYLHIKPKLWLIIYTLILYRSI